MKRCWQESRLHFSPAALGIDKKQAIEEFDLVRGTHSTIEVLQVRATAQGHVLAVVNVLTIRQDVGSCASAKERTLLKQPDPPAGISQRDAGRQPRQPAADHDHAFQGYSLPLGARTAPYR